MLKKLQARMELQLKPLINQLKVSATITIEPVASHPPTYCACPTNSFLWLNAVRDAQEVKDAEPPDFGFHVDWTREQALKAIKRGNAANGGGSNKSGTGAGGNPLDTYWSDKTAVEVDMVSESGGQTAVGRWDGMCVCVCVCVRARERVWVCVCVWRK
jgi:hypothetical protein